MCQSLLIIIHPCLLALGSDITSLCKPILFPMEEVHHRQMMLSGFAHGRPTASGSTTRPYRPRSALVMRGVAFYVMATLRLFQPQVAGLSERMSLWIALTKHTRVLKPILPWTVGRPANDPLNQKFTVQIKFKQDTIFPLALFSIAGDDFNPLQIEYDNPIFLKLKYSGKWDPLWAVIPENYTSTDWVSSNPPHIIRCCAPKDPALTSHVLVRHLN